MVAKGITPDEGFIPWYVKEEMKRRAQQYRQQIGRIKQELWDRTIREWNLLPDEERERWREQIRNLLAGMPVKPDDDMAQYAFQKEVVFDLVANERGTPPERREKLRKILYG